VKRVVVGLSVALTLALALALPGAAAAAAKRVGVPKFEGPQEALVRKKVMQILKSQGYDLVKSREIEASGVSLDSNDGYKALAKELALSAIVTGELSAKKARISVRDGSDGSVSGEGSFSGANPRKVAAEVGKSFWRRLGSAVERGKVPSGAKKPQASTVAESADDKEDSADTGGGSGGDDEAEDKDKAKAKDKDKDSDSKTVAKSESDDSSSKSSDEESEKPRKRRKKAAPEAVAEAPASSGGSERPWLDAAVGGRGFTRDFVYNQDINKVLRQYKLGMGPAAAADISFYPFGMGDNGPMSNLGVQLGVEQAFGITSRVGMSTAFPDGATFPTVIHDYSGAVKYRIPFDVHEVGVSLGGGEHAFAFRSNGSADRSLLDLPDTIYRYVRLGLSGRFGLPGGFAVLAGGGYRYIFNKGGQIHDQFFPHLSVAGVDANLAVAYKVTPMIEARLGGDVRRYFYDMKSQAGDTLLAGGAVDQYISVTAMLAFMLGGEGGAGHPADDEAEPPPDMGKEKTRPGAGGERDE
jgi:hypothetical protein